MSGKFLLDETVPRKIQVGTGTAVPIKNNTLIFTSDDKSVVITAANGKVDLAAKGGGSGDVKSLCIGDETKRGTLAQEGECVIPDAQGQITIDWDPPFKLTPGPNKYTIQDDGSIPTKIKGNTGDPVAIKNNTIVITGESGFNFISQSEGTLVLSHKFRSTDDSIQITPEEDTLNFSVKSVPGTGIKSIGKFQSIDEATPNAQGRVDFEFVGHLVNLIKEFIVSGNKVRVQFMVPYFAGDDFQEGINAIQPYTFNALPFYDIRGDADQTPDSGIRTKSAKIRGGSYQDRLIIYALSSSTTQMGTIRCATAAEAEAGTLDNVAITPATLKTQSGRLRYIKNNSNITMQTNTFYDNIDPNPNPPVEYKLPVRGDAKEGDVIEVLNATGTSFRIVLNTDLILHYKGNIIEDTDNKVLLGDKKGSYVRLVSGGNQQWYAFSDYEITLTTKEPLEND